jgi:hypothetical protein
VRTVTHRTTRGQSLSRCAARCCWRSSSSLRRSSSAHRPPWPRHWRGRHRFTSTPRARSHPCPVRPRILCCGGQRQQAAHLRSRELYLAGDRKRDRHPSFGVLWVLIVLRCWGFRRGRRQLQQRIAEICLLRPGVAFQSDLLRCGGFGRLRDRDGRWRRQLEHTGPDHRHHRLAAPQCCLVRHRELLRRGGQRGKCLHGGAPSCPTNTGPAPAPTPMADAPAAAPPGAPAPPIDILESSVRVGLKALSTEGRTLKVPMSCPVPATCTGRVVIDHFSSAVPRGTAAGRVGGHRAGRIVLGTARFSLAGESSRFVTIRLGKTAEEMLSRQRGRVIHVTLTASVAAIGYPSDVVGRYFRLTRRR